MVSRELCCQSHQWCYSLRHWQHRDTHDHQLAINLSFPGSYYREFSILAGVIATGQPQECHLSLSNRTRDCSTADPQEQDRSHGHRVLQMEPGFDGPQGSADVVFGVVYLLCVSVQWWHNYSMFPVCQGMIIAC